LRPAVLPLAGAVLLIASTFGTASPAANASASSPAACAVSPPDGSGYWRTSGNRILDSQGRLVRIAAVNWYGMEDRYFVPEGLAQQPLDVLLARIRELGFNAIRLAFSNQMVEENPIVLSHVDANPDLKGLHALDVLDRIVTSAGRAGLRIILENHRSSVGQNPDESGLWYTAHYPERSWIHDWQVLAARYRHNPTVAGFDLRNEPHTRPPGPWSLRTYLRQGATWGPYRGKENAATDWRLAAERAGNAVLAINPDVLIIVEGIQQYPDASNQTGVDSYWWGGVLGPAARYPVRLKIAHRLVYSPHEYGPLKYPMRWFGPNTRYSTLLSVWTAHWAYLDKARSSSAVPIFLGEFGTCGRNDACVQSSVPGSQGFWFSSLMEYFTTHPEVGWAFWALDAVNPHGKVMTNYILRPDWTSVRLPALIDAFHAVEAAPCK
jgi:endoglucanase